MDQVVAALGEGPGRVRIEVRPAGRMAAFMEFLAQLAGEGRLTRLGFPKPEAAADLILQFSDTGHANRPRSRCSVTLPG
ncbi:MAG TPA: hypothetical protein VGL78_17255 [Solirubrobacteraceae bacterium]